MDSRRQQSWPAGAAVDLGALTRRHRRPPPLTTRCLRSVGQCDARIWLSQPSRPAADRSRALAWEEERVSPWRGGRVACLAASHAPWAAIAPLHRPPSFRPGIPHPHTHTLDEYPIHSNKRRHVERTSSCPSFLPVTNLSSLSIVSFISAVADTAGLPRRALLTRYVKLSATTESCSASLNSLRFWYKYLSDFSVCGSRATQNDKSRCCCTLTDAGKRCESFSTMLSTCFSLVRNWIRNRAIDWKSWFDTSSLCQHHKHQRLDERWRATTVNHNRLRT